MTGAPVIFWANDARYNERGADDRLDTRFGLDACNIAALHQARIAESCWAVAATMLLDWLLREEA